MTDIGFTSQSPSGVCAIIGLCRDQLEIQLPQGLNAMVKDTVQIRGTESSTKRTGNGSCTHNIQRMALSNSNHHKIEFAVWLRLP